MPRKFTYKELLLIVGVAVALAIGAGFWLKASDAPGMKASLIDNSVVQKTTSLSVLSALLEKSIPAIKF